MTLFLPSACYTSPALASLPHCRDGSVILVEYFERRPIFLLQPGMGLRLLTYYRKTDDGDTGYQALQQEHREGLDAYSVSDWMHTQ